MGRSWFKLYVYFLCFYHHVEVCFCTQSIYNVYFWLEKFEINHCDICFELAHLSKTEILEETFFRLNPT
jgi:hypothetical protein